MVISFTRFLYTIPLPTLPAKRTTRTKLVKQGLVSDQITALSPDKKGSTFVPSGSLLPGPSAPLRVLAFKFERQPTVISVYVDF